MRVALDTSMRASAGIGCRKMNRSGRIKAISFDGDMTLWDFEKVMRHSLSLALAELRRRALAR